MYVVSAKACTVASGERPLDQAQVDRERVRRADLEAGIAENFRAMERAVHRRPEDFVDVPGDFSRLAKKYPKMVAERVPAKDRPWPDGYRTECTLRQRETPGVLSLRPIYERPFPIASSTAPAAPQMECSLQSYRPPYRADTGDALEAPAAKDNRPLLWALVLGALVFGAVA